MAQLSRIQRVSEAGRFAPFPAELFHSVRTRAALVAERRPKGVSGPPLRYMLRELDFLTSGRAAEADFDVAPCAEPKLVMLLPGFATHPVRMRRMATKLEEAGHTVKRWGMGFNFGPTAENFDCVCRRVMDLHRRYGMKVHLVGWSLGGLFAREVAKRHPQAVAKVVTMGSPFSGDARANNVWRVYQMVTGHSVDNPPVGKHRAIKPPVPTVAFWSPRDGLIHPRASRGQPGERDKEVALRCSHLGFAYSNEAIGAVLTELDAG